MTLPDSVDVLVVGAGPTGLAAAWQLTTSGATVAVVDRAPAPGGMSASLEIAGQRVDFGSHRLHGRADPELLADLRQLLGDDLQSRQRNGRIRLEGQWVAFPLRAGDLVRHLPRRFAVGAALDSLLSPFRSPKGEDFGSQVRAGLGSTVFEAFYEPYATKLWGLDASEIDGSMADRRVSAGGPIDILKRLISARNEEGRVFYYPKLGYGQITDAMADAVSAAGGVVQCETSLESLRLSDDGAEVTLVGPTGPSEIEAKAVVSTIPAPQLVAAVTPAADPAVEAAAASLEQRGMLFVYLVLSRPQYTTFDAHYFPGLDTVIARLSEPKNYRTGPDPTDQTVLCAEIACTVGDELWTASEADLGERVARELESQGLPSPQHAEVHVRRLPSVYPVYRHGYRTQLDTVERWANGLPRLLLVGRQGLFVPDNLHHTIAMGRAAAAVIGPDGAIDRSAWARARNVFRTHVVED